LGSATGRTQAAALPSQERVDVRSSPAAQVSGAADRPLVVGLRGEPNLDFNSVATLNSLEVLGQVMEGLYRYAPDGSIEPAGATTYVVSADGLVYTYTLRSDAYWSDGQAVIAQHYVDSYLRLLDPGNNPDPDNPVAYASLVVDLIKGADGYMRGTITDTSEVGVTAVDTTTLRFTLEYQASRFPSLMAGGAFCPVRLDLIGSDPDYWTEAAHFVGNGPYVLTAWVHGSYLTLSKTLTYHSHGQVTIDEIQFRILDDAGQLVAYENDQLDVSAVPSDELPRVLADPVLGGEFHRTPQPGVYFLGMNTQLTPTNNITVRMALASAIDRSDILTNVLNMPWREEATSVIPAGIPGYQNGEVGHTFSPTQAQAYLAAAGYPNGAGFPGIELWASYGNEATIDAVADGWRTYLNITVTTFYTDWGTYRGLLAGCHGDPGACSYNAYRLGWLMDYADASNVLNDLFHPDSQNQSTGWDSLRYRDLISMSITETNQISRTAYFTEADQILVEDEAVVTPIFFYDRQKLIKHDVLYEYAPYGGPYLMNWRFTAIQTGTITDTGGTITSPDGDILVEFPDGAVSDTIAVTYTAFHVPPHPPTSTFAFACNAFMLEVVQVSSGEQITTFAEPLTLTIQYTDGDLGGVDENTLELRYWDGSAWVTDGITIVERDTVNNTIVVRIEHLTEFAMLGRRRVYLPLVVRNWTE
jgi:oligopeptide transport system substrate-binding protein